MNLFFSDHQFQVLNYFILINHFRFQRRLKYKSGLFHYSVIDCNVLNSTPTGRSDAKKALYLLHEEILTC